MVIRYAEWLFAYGKIKVNFRALRLGNFIYNKKPKVFEDSKGTFFQKVPLVGRGATPRKCASSRLRPAGCLEGVKVLASASTQTADKIA